ncbi:hypothetical protein BSZ35_02405 [Salinibacter sp. 10B]|uniref:PIN domain-containing protein n=1 Tax=Salinibacter sp. 10B TaxID=1923971 RepID=UPI000CF4A6C7|nr:PIN domain-containing protein [Salinibacter sp. 10B]PQJ33601.1 hypothetical protein BSZ35_02405 [Salinibacter sp. 10B]
MTYAILDTNFFLHFKQIEDVDWREMLDADSVKLVIPRRMIEELDEKKDEGSSEKLRDRARKAQGNIEQYLFENDTNEIQSSVLLDHYRKLPEKYFNSKDLDRDTPDDHLVATALHIKENTNDSESRVLIVTNDIGPRLSAEPRNVNTEKPPEHLRLPNPKSELEKEIARLRHEKQRLEGTMPDLGLRFDNGKDHLEVGLDRDRVISSEEIKSEMSNVKQQFPPKEYPEDCASMDDLKSSINSSIKKKIGEEVENEKVRSTIPKEEYERYNSDLENFYEDYASYLEDKRENSIIENMIIDINLKMVNDGTTPGEDIDIVLRFPEAVHLFNEDPVSDLEEPSRPEPPTPPKTFGDLVGDRGLGGTASQAALISPKPIQGAELLQPQLRTGSSPIVENRNEDISIAKYHVTKLKHNQGRSLSSIYAIFSPPGATKNFEINYEMTAANVPNPITGSLHVVIEEGSD